MSGLGPVRDVRDWIVGHRVPDLPRPGIGPLTAAKWLVDEWSLQAELVNNRTRIPSATFRHRLWTEMDEALDLFGSAGWLAQPRSYHQDPPPLERPRISVAGYVPSRFEWLRFTSEYVPHRGEPGRERWLGYENNRTAHAWVLRHNDGPRPWLVCVNGYRTGTAAADLLAFDALRLHRKLGMNVLIPVNPLHGPRRAGRSGDRVMFAGVMNIVHTVSQAVWDIRRMLTWLRKSEGAPRVGVMGFSLGGYIASVLASIEQDIDGVMLGVPESDLVRNIRRQVDPMLPPFYEQWGLSWSSFDRVTRVVSPYALTPLVPKEGRAIFAGLVDRWVRPGNVHRLWQHWDEPDICWYQGSHLSFPVERKVRRFVDEHFDSWGLTTAEPASSPVTSVLAAVGNTLAAVRGDAGSRNGNGASQGTATLPG